MGNLRSGLWGQVYQDIARLEADTEYRRGKVNMTAKYTARERGVKAKHQLAEGLKQLGYTRT